MSATTPPSMRTFEEPRIEALVELMFLAASADGDFSEEERQHFMRSVESLTDRRLPQEALDALVTRIEAELRQGGRAARLASLKDQLVGPGLRRAALSLVIQVTAADGIIRTSERELLFEVAEALEIDQDEAADLVQKLTP